MMQQILFNLLTIYLHGYTYASKDVIIMTKDGKSYLAKTEPAKNLNKSSTEKKFSSASRQLNRNFAELSEGGEEEIDLTTPPSAFFHFLSRRRKLRGRRKRRRLRKIKTPRILRLDEHNESKESKKSHGSVTSEKSEESEGSEESKSKTNKFVDVSGTKDGCGRCFTNDKSSAIMITYQSY